MYACPTWGRMSQTHIDKISTNQRRCLRNAKLYNTPYRPVESLIISSSMVKFYNIITTNNQYVDHLHSVQVMHDHYTKKSPSFIRPPRYRLALSKRSFLGRCCDTWNVHNFPLPDDTLRRFKSHLNEILLPLESYVRPIWVNHGQVVYS